MLNNIMDFLNLYGELAKTVFGIFPEFRLAFVRGYFVSGMIQAASASRIVTHIPVGTN